MLTILKRWVKSRSGKNEPFNLSENTQNQMQLSQVCILILQRYELCSICLILLTSLTIYRAVGHQYQFHAILNKESNKIPTLPCWTFSIVFQCWLIWSYFQKNKCQSSFIFQKKKSKSFRFGKNSLCCLITGECINFFTFYIINHPF